MPPYSAPIVPTTEPAWAIRLEAKLDVALTQHSARIDAQEREVLDHEARIRVIEAKHTVSPQVLWTSVLGGLTGLSAIMAILYNLLPPMRG